MGNATGGVRFGHRVLETTEGSPSHDAKLIVYLDFVVAINDVQLVSGTECDTAATLQWLSAWSPSFPFMSHRHLRHR
jgi:hypothetical protein